MKKVLLGLVALSTVSFAAQGDMYLNARVGGDLGATYTKYVDKGEEILSDETDKFGGELGLEGYKSITNNFDLGLGVAYQLHAERADAPIKNTKVYVYGGEYSSIPIYLIAKYNFNLDSQIRPYLKANMGYSFNFNANDIVVSGTTPKVELDIENGLYWAFGGGVEYKNFTLDLMYAVNKAKIKAKQMNIKGDNDYGRVVLSAGYKFNL